MRQPSTDIVDNEQLVLFNSAAFANQQQVHLLQSATGQFVSYIATLLSYFAVSKLIVQLRSVTLYSVIALQLLLILVLNRLATTWVLRAHKAYKDADYSPQPGSFDVRNMIFVAEYAHELAAFWEKYALGFMVFTWLRVFGNGVQYATTLKISKIATTLVFLLTVLALSLFWRRNEKSTRDHYVPRRDPIGDLEKATAVKASVRAVAAGVHTRYWASRGAAGAGAADGARRRPAGDRAL